MGAYKFDFENLSPEELGTEEILKYIHHVLFEVVIIKGSMTCNNCNREYTINDGVANMVLLDDEV
jgi:uncharacterized protein YbaR (Trm112 family)